MKKLMNKPSGFVDEMLDGLVAANSSLTLGGEMGRVVHRAVPIRQGKVGVVSGGGSGHLPLFTGYVGEGLLDACSIGNVFEGPTVGSCMEAIRLADGGKGVLRLYGNYGGDRMNFDMAGEMLEDEGIRTTTVLGNDDVASAAPAERQKRREGEKFGGDFDQCPKYSELAIAPADKDKDGRFDTIAMVASPYVAGPYVEGEYEIDVPVTRQLIAALKPAYRNSFEAQRQ